jgi:hypothetical protein
MNHMSIPVLVWYDLWTNQLGPSVVYFFENSYQPGPDILSKIKFWPVGQVCGIETGINLVKSWYYLRFNEQNGEMNKNLA